MSDEHISFDELAELAEGLLARRRAGEVTRHLEGCEECQARAAAIERTTGLLHDLGPVTMPPDVAARLDRVIATAGEAPSGETVVPDLGTVRRRRQGPPPWAYAAAAAVVVIGAAAGVLATTGHHHNVPSAAANRPAPLVATSAPPAFVQQESGQVYTPSSLTALAPGLVSGGVASAASGASAGAPLAPQPNAATKSAPGSPGFAPQAPVHSAEQFSAALVPKALQRYAMSRQALLACAAYITDTPGAAPLAVDFARWSDPKTHARQVPSMVLVFADPQQSSSLDVYVVGAACNDSSLLDFQIMPRS